jgi:isoleucyl-tRNA synthetase
VHLEDWPGDLSSWSQPRVDAEIGSLLAVRGRVNEAIEPLRAAGRVGKSLDAAITIKVSKADPVGDLLLKYRDSLAEIFIVSAVAVEVSAGPTDPKGPQGQAAGGDPLVVGVVPCSELGHVRCPRCWRWVPSLVHNALAEVCPRCAEALRP